MLAASNGDRYLYGHDRIGVELNNAWSYPLPDALGSVRQGTDAAGNVTGVASYEPFGKLLSSQGASDPFGFTGERSAATGLQYLRAKLARALVRSGERAVRGRGPAINRRATRPRPVNRASESPVYGARFRSAAR